MDFPKAMQSDMKSLTSRLISAEVLSKHEG